MGFVAKVDACRLHVREPFELQRAGQSSRSPRVVDGELVGELACRMVTSAGERANK